MCGINGYLQFNNQFDEEKMRSVINNMNLQVFHRGPDENGTYVNEEIAIGMTRLSIIDLESGSQPIFNSDRTKVIVLNGEIYNYKSIRASLVKKGRSFDTHSDTEVVLQAFEEYGSQCLAEFRGMFSFAIYDFKKKSLFVARDRTGEKPLYYFKTEKAFIFASEQKSILSTGLVKKEISIKALNQYLQLTYIPSPLSIFEGVFKLPPASYLILDSQNNLKVEKYWNFTINEESKIKDYNKCKVLLRKTLIDSVEKCMISDVPIGAFLSGGIDSTTIVALMAHRSSAPINTFTIGFKEKKFDESKFATVVAKKYKTNHSSFILNHDDALNSLDHILSNMDEPFADSSLLPTYFVSKLASKHVKVALTGDGGDELFAGYNKYLLGYYQQKLKFISSVLGPNTLSKVLNIFPEKMAFQKKLRKVLETSGKENLEQRLSLMSLGFKEQEMSSLLIKGLDKTSLDIVRSYYKRVNESTDDLSKTLYTDFHVVLEGDMLTKVDRMSMLNSLETRVPMLDKTMIELAAKIPIEYKIKKNQLKLILKDTFNDLIPEELLNAPKKGFEVPIGNWFKNELKVNLMSVFDKNSIEEQGIFNFTYIQTIIEEHMSNKRDRSSEIWTLYVFQIWYKNFFIV